MYDYNYFESYQAKKNTGNKPVIIILVFFFALLLLTIGSIIALKVMLKQDIREMTDLLALEENQVILNRLNDKERLIGQLNAINQDLRNAPTILEGENPINGALLDNIVKSLPADAQLTDISITQDSVVVIGKAALPSAIAEFQHNLRLIIKAEDISVSNIQIEDESEGFYTFEMTIYFRRNVDESIQ